MPVGANERMREVNERSLGGLSISRNQDLQLGRIIVFAAYSVIYEAIIWGWFGYGVFLQGNSGWWILLAMLLSSAQLKPRHFGFETKGGAR